MNMCCDDTFPSQKFHVLELRMDLPILLDHLLSEKRNGVFCEDSSIYLEATLQEMADQQCVRIRNVSSPSKPVLNQSDSGKIGIGFVGRRDW